MWGGVGNSVLDEVEEEARFIVRADEKHDGIETRSKVGTSWKLVKFAGKEGGGGVGREEKLETMSWKAAAKLAREELVEPPCIYR